MSFDKYLFGGEVWQLRKCIKPMAIVTPVVSTTDIGTKTYSVDVVTTKDYLVIDQDLNCYGLEAESAERIITQGKKI